MILVKNISDGGNEDCGWRGLWVKWNLISD